MITNNYILMCMEAKKIQKEWKQENGDWVFWKVTKSIKIITDSFYTNNLKYFIWLPTQEQLMDMIYKVTGLCRTHLYGVMEILLKFLGEEYIDGCIPDEYFTTSKEKLLAFVYKAGYNKIWTGEKWVKAENE